MKVAELMTKQVAFCLPSSSLKDAAHEMWLHDCGAIPVVSESATKKVVGMITDRDITLASYHKGLTLTDLKVQDAMSVDVVSCTPNEDVRAAQELMQQYRVRRIPIVTRTGELVGILSLAHLARGSTDGRQTPLSEEDVAQTLASVSLSRRRDITEKVTRPDLGH
jgi:CBS domain-containing protein